MDALADASGYDVPRSLPRFFFLPFPRSLGVAKEKPTGNKTRDLIIRIVIFGALGVVLVLAVLDYRIKQQATNTGAAWRELLKEANENDVARLHVEALQEGIEGSPVLSENQGQNVYTWKGTFREYVIKVEHDNRLNKAVQEITGPGEDDAED
jgi:hypothetical protein